MGSRCKLLMLLSFSCCLIGAMSAEAKTCFIVGQCGGEITPKLAEQQNCKDLGYEKTAEGCAAEGKIAAGGKCGDYYEKCACDTSKYPYVVGESHAPYVLTGGICSDDDGVHREYKVCPPKYKYSEGCTSEAVTVCRYASQEEPIEAVSYTKGESCLNGSVLGGESCEEIYPIDIRARYIRSSSQIVHRATHEVKYTECICDASLYKYKKDTSLGWSEDAFVLDDSCKANGSETEQYKTAVCNESRTNRNYYYTSNNTCLDGYKYSSVDDKSLKDLGNGIFTCHKCVKEGCDDVSGYSYDNCIAKLSVNDGKQCRPHETIANCYILETGGSCPVTLPSITTCPEGYTQGTCPNGQWCAQKDGCYKVIEKYGCSAVCSKALHTASYMPYMRDVAVFLKNLISINKAHAQTVVAPIGGGGIGGGGIGGGTVTKMENTIYWSEKSSTTCAGGEVADCYECEYSGYGVRYGTLYDSEDSCNSSGTVCDKLFEDFHYTVGNSTVYFKLDDEEDVGGSCYTVRYTTVYD